MKILKVQLDYLAGPVWKPYFNPKTKSIYTGIPVVDNDEIIAELDEQIQNLYSSYYEFDSHDQACWFNFEQEKADKEKMLSLLNRLISRLNEINDGSFEIDDCETERVKSL